MLDTTDADMRTAESSARYQTLPLSDMEIFAQWESAIEVYRPAGDTAISQTHA